MKKYIKNINNEQVIKTINQIVVITEDKQIFNPTEEMILADGWEEYIYEQPVYEPQEISLDLLKHIKRGDILAYDKSSYVNEFIINGESVWLDKATRTGLLLRLNAEEQLGETTTTLGYNSKEFILPITDARNMLYAIEVYASKCYDNTQKHLANLDALVTKEDIENYDFKKGYPEKLNF